MHDIAHAWRRHTKVMAPGTTMPSFCVALYRLKGNQAFFLRGTRSVDLITVLTDYIYIYT